MCAWEGRSPASISPTMSNLQPNPLLAMRGLPPFSAIRADSVEPAIDAVLAENREGLRRVLDSNEAPSVSAVIVPVEQLRHRLARTWSPVSRLLSATFPS